MRIERQWHGETLALGIHGKLTTSEHTETLLATIEDQVARGHHKMVIDLGRLRRVDSEGLGTLLQCLQRVRKAGGELKLAGATKRVSHLLVIAGLLRVFDVHDGVPDAVRAFEAASESPLPAVA